MLATNKYQANIHLCLKNTKKSKYSLNRKIWNANSNGVNLSVDFKAFMLFCVDNF